ncbi:hypothetical protein DFH09DRAFT_1439536 [Mycena vulgaris]|nr:hypothetical protein DFH09DRAFT_1439536 [Mycena vulgaris]
MAPLNSEFLERACKPQAKKAGEIIQCSLTDERGEPGQGRVIPTRNGLVDTVTLAYNKLAPGFNYCVNANAEPLRASFVAHEGTRELVITAEGTRYTLDFGEMSRQMVGEMEKNVVDPALRVWALPAFTTTTENDTTISAMLMMATLKATSRTHVAWYPLLVLIISGFVKSLDTPGSPETVKFWQQVAHYETAAAGPPIMPGHLRHRLSVLPFVYRTVLKNARRQRRDVRVRDGRGHHRHASVLQREPRAEREREERHGEPGGGWWIFVKKRWFTGSLNNSVGLSAAAQNLLSAKPIIDLVKQIAKLTLFLPETVALATEEDDILRRIFELEGEDGTVASTFNRQGVKVRRSRRNPTVAFRRLNPELLEKVKHKAADHSNSDSETDSDSDKESDSPTVVAESVPSNTVVSAPAVGEDPSDRVHHRYHRKKRAAKTKWKKKVFPSHTHSSLIQTSTCAQLDSRSFSVMSHLHRKPALQWWLVLVRPVRTTKTWEGW